MRCRNGADSFGVGRTAERYDVSGPDVGDTADVDDTAGAPSHPPSSAQMAITVADSVAKPGARAARPAHAAPVCRDSRSGPSADSPRELMMPGDIGVALRSHSRPAGRAQLIDSCPSRYLAGTAARGASDDPAAGTPSMLGYHTPLGYNSMVMGGPLREFYAGSPARRHHETRPRRLLTVPTTTHPQRQGGAR